MAGGSGAQACHFHGADCTPLQGSLHGRVHLERHPQDVSAHLGPARRVEDPAGDLEPGGRAIEFNECLVALEEVEEHALLDGAVQRGDVVMASQTNELAGSPIIPAWAPLAVEEGQEDRLGAIEALPLQVAVRAVAPGQVLAKPLDAVAAT